MRKAQLHTIILVAVIVVALIGMYFIFSQGGMYGRAGEQPKSVRLKMAVGEVKAVEGNKFALDYADEGKLSYAVNGVPFKSAYGVDIDVGEGISVRPLRYFAHDSSVMFYIYFPAVLAFPVAPPVVVPQPVVVPPVVQPVEQPVQVPGFKPCIQECKQQAASCVDECYEEAGISKKFAVGKVGVIGQKVAVEQVGVIGQAEVVVNLIPDAKPDVLGINPGDKVVFKNPNNYVLGVDINLKKGPVASFKVQPGGSYEYTFDQAGAYFASLKEGEPYLFILVGVKVDVEQVYGAVAKSEWTQKSKLW